VKHQNHLLLLLLFILFYQKMLKANQNDESTVQSISQLKSAFDNAEKNKTWIFSSIYYQYN